jgi:hypothetical protein
MKGNCRFFAFLRAAPHVIEDELPQPQFDEHEHDNHTEFSHGSVYSSD